MANTTALPNITLYTAATPNGIKISMALEVLGLVSQRLIDRLYHD